MALRERVLSSASILSTSSLRGHTLSVSAKSRFRILSDSPPLASLRTKSWIPSGYLRLKRQIRCGGVALA